MTQDITTIKGLVLENNELYAKISKLKAHLSLKDFTIKNLKEKMGLEEIKSLRRENIRLRKKRKELNKKVRFLEKSVTNSIIMSDIIKYSQDLEYIRHLFVKKIVIMILNEKNDLLSIKKINQLSMEKFKFSFQESYLRANCNQLFKQEKLSKTYNKEKLLFQFGLRPQ